MSRRTSRRSRFAALVQPHFDALYGAARRLALSPSDAEDLVQDVCLKAHTHIDELEKIEFQRAWLLKTLYHRFIDIQRSRERSPDHRTAQRPKRTARRPPANVAGVMPSASR